MDKLKLSEWGDKIKTGGAQMSRLVSDKVKEILQTPTLESRMVDETTSETLAEPNWGMNLRICGMINSEEFNGTEIVKSIKKKISGKSVVSQRLGLELLEVCAMNCEKVFSEVASEKVLDEMVKLIKNPESDVGNRNRASQLIRAWGESEDLSYLPVFRQTYMNLRDENRGMDMNDGDTQYSLEAYLNQPPVPPPETYPIPRQERAGSDESALAYNFGNLSIEEKKQCIEETRNSLELLNSMLNTEEGAEFRKDDLTVSLVGKCKESQPMIQLIIESTNDDEGLLFEALNLNDELQRVISKYVEQESSVEPVEQPTQDTEIGAKPTEHSPETNVMRDSDLTQETETGAKLIKHSPKTNVVKDSDLTQHTETGAKPIEQSPKTNVVTDSDLGEAGNKRENPGKTETAESSSGQREDQK